MSIFLGMDVGGTSVKLGAWQAGQRLIWRAGLPVPGAVEERAVADELAAHAEALAAELASPVTALGVGSCGLISEGVILQSPNTAWDRLAAVELLGGRLGWPVYLLNDADAFLLAALDVLARRDGVVLGVTLGTGIGTALWVRDHLFAGGAGISPEAGHITLGTDQPPSNAGIPGSWESLACRAALLRYYADAGGHAADPREVAAAARRGESAALTAWQRYGHYAGAGLGSLCNVFNPEHVLIGGGLAEAHGLFEAPLHVALRQFMLAAIPRPGVHFIEGREDTVARGAAYYAEMRTGNE